MRWPLRRHRNGKDAQQARQSAEAAVDREKERLAEIREVVHRLAAHRERNRFAEGMRQAFGGRP